MANCYNTGLESLSDGTIQWGTSDIRVILLTSSHSFTAEDDMVSDISANEISQAVRGTLAGEAVTVDDGNDEVQLDATDLTFSSLAAGDTPNHAAAYLYNAADSAAQLLCSCSLTTPPAPNGGDYTIVWGGEGVMEVSNT